MPPGPAMKPRYDLYAPLSAKTRVENANSFRMTLVPTISMVGNFPTLGLLFEDDPPLLIESVDDRRSKCYKASLPMRRSIILIVSL